MVVSMGAKMIYLSAAEVKDLVDMAELIPVIKTAFIQLSRGTILVPQRMHLDIDQYQGTELIKPVYSQDLGMIAVKMISLFKGNPAIGLPFSHALLILMDAETGRPLAIMDADYLTALRTGAASGVATDLLAPADSQTAAIFGAGFQARQQIMALSIVRNLTRVYILDPDEPKIQQLAEELSKKLQIDILKGESEEILKEVDIICTVTTSDQPVFSDENIAPGTHINGIGSFQPGAREIPGDTVKRSRVYVDQKEACLLEAGDLRIPIKEGIVSKNHIFGEIGSLADGKLTGRKSASDITLFKSVGNAVQDLYAANLVYQKAKNEKIGQILTL
jgi:ornithine cyclodeaminase/alanine dehydrogenase-like protein (mu-crystallin family)